MSDDRNEGVPKAAAIALPVVHEDRPPAGENDTDRQVSSQSALAAGKLYDCFLQGDVSADPMEASQDLDELVEALACLCARIDFRKGRRKRASSFSQTMEAAERLGSGPVAIDDVDPLEA